MDITITLFYQPIFNLIIVLYRLFGENLGLAIIVVALLSRLITLPIAFRQRKMAGKSQELQKKIKEIKEKHKNNKAKEQEEMMKLNSEYASQFAGCLPLILQFIIFINVYNVIRELFTHGVSAFNSLAYSFVPQFAADYQLKYSFLNIVDLSKHPADFASAGLAFLPYIIILALVGLTQYFSMKTAMNMTGMPKAEPKKEDKKKDKKDGKSNEDFSEILQQSTKQTMLLFPIMFVFLAYSLPTGLSVYWIVQSAFVIIQQFFFNNPGKFKSYLTKKKTNDIIAEPDAIIQS